MDVVYKRKTDWCTGKIDEGKLRKKKSLRVLSDATEKDEYYTLKQWLKATKSKEAAEDILAKYKVDRLYIKKEKIPAPSLSKKASPSKVKDPSVPKEPVYAPTEKEWWAKFNDLCLQCVKKCKQSAYVTIVSCKMEPIKGV